MPQETSAERLARIRARRQSSTSRGSVISRGWRAISTPITDITSRATKETSKEFQSIRENMDNPYLAGAIGFVEGANEGLGDFFTELTSPIDLASTLTGLGSINTGRRAVQNINRAANTLTAGRGAENVLTGFEEGDVSKGGAGLVEAGLSAAGIKGSFKPSIKPRPVARNTSGVVSTKNPVNRTVQPEGLPSESADTYGIIRNTNRNAPNAARNTYGIRASSIDPQTGAPIPERLRSSTNQRVIDALLPSRTRELIRADAPILKDSNANISSSGIGNQTIVQTNPNARGQSTVKKGSGKVKGVKTPKITKPVKPAISQEQFIKDLTAAGFTPEQAKQTWAQRFGQLLKDEKGSANLDLLTGRALFDSFKGTGQKVKDLFNVNMINNSSKVVQKLKPAYQTWVNDRRARLGYSYNVKQDFKDLEKLGMDGVFAYNAGDRSGRFADVEKWFNQKHAEFTAVKKALGAKHDIGFKDNYLPQIWDNSAEEIQKVFGKRLGLRARIEMPSIIKDYQEGIAKGLTPKYKSIPDLMGYYTEVMEKNIADVKFFNQLRDSGLLKRQGSKQTDGWVPLTQDIFPIIHTNQGKMNWAAPPEVAEIVENYLKPRGKLAQSWLRGVQLTKDIALASGLPGTAFNAHGFNMMRRSAVAKGWRDFGSGTVKALKYMSKSGSDKSIASRFLDKVLPWESAHQRIEKSRDLIPRIMRSGGTLGVEGHDFDQKLANMAIGQMNPISKGAAKAFDAVANKHNQWFETHLFDKMIPALKIDFWESAVDDLIKQGLKPEIAEREASRAMNLAFSGVNYDELATNKQVLDIARSVLLAPDWYASNIGLTKNAMQSIMNSNHPGAKLYRNAANGLLTAYLSANVLQAALTGYNEGKPKIMLQNESGRTFDIDTGAYTVDEKGNKKKVYVSPFGTAFDAVKIPFELISNAFKGDLDKLPQTLKNRTSLPVHSGINFLSNTNDFGERMFGEDVYGRDIPLSTELGNLAGDVMFKPVTPSYMNAVRGLATKRMTPLEASLSAIEAPVIFKRQDSNTRRRRRRTRSR